MNSISGVTIPFSRSASVTHFPRRACDEARLGEPILEALAPVRRARAVEQKRVAARLDPVQAERELLRMSIFAAGSV